MIDLYTGLRINQFVILCGPPLDGKSTVWKVVSKALNSLQPKDSNSVCIFSIIELYSTIVVYLSKK